MRFQRVQKFRWLRVLRIEGFLQFAMLLRIFMKGPNSVLKMLELALYKQSPGSTGSINVLVG